MSICVHLIANFQMHPCSYFHGLLQNILSGSSLEIWRIWHCSQGVQSTFIYIYMHIWFVTTARFYTQKVWEEMVLSVIYLKTCVYIHIYVNISCMWKYICKRCPLITWVSFPAAPRTYPPKFARKICSLMPSLIRDAEGQPKVPESPVFEELRQYPWTDWDEANLKPVVRYLYGSHSMSMPEDWRICFPKRLWWWFVKILPYAFRMLNSFSLFWKELEVTGRIPNEIFQPAISVWTKFQFFEWFC